MNEKPKIKLIVVLIASLLILTVITTAQFTQTGELKTIGPITNNGPVNVGSKITFNGKCEGLETRLILCKDNSICNPKTKDSLIICKSNFSFTKEKSCSYATTQFDEGLHENDIATCCESSGLCDTQTLSVNPWIANVPSNMQIVTGSVVEGVYDFIIPQQPQEESKIKEDNFTIPEESEKLIYLKINPPILNNGPVNEGSEITFTGNCQGQDTKLIVCRENKICNTNTLQKDKICESKIDNINIKNCVYATSSSDMGLNENDIATCCDIRSNCDATTVLINPWRVAQLTEKEEIFDNITIPQTPKFEKQKEKSIDEIITEVGISTPKEKIKEIKRIGFAAEEITLQDEKKELVIHKPIINGLPFEEIENVVPLNEKDDFSYTVTFEETTLDIEFDAPEIKENKDAKNFSKKKITNKNSWKIAYSYLLPSLNFTPRLRISSSSPIHVTDTYNGKIETGKLILDFKTERENNFDIELNQIHSNIIYVELNRSYSDYNISTNDEITLDPTLTISGTSTEVCGEVTAYDKIEVINSGIMTICAKNATAITGYANITLGAYGNFTLDSTSKIEGSGKGARGGTGCSGNTCTATQGENGTEFGTGAASTNPNGGGGGGGNRPGNSDSVGGGGGGFGGRGGVGGYSAAGTKGKEGNNYGSSTGLQLFSGSAGGGSSSDTTAPTGANGGAGLKINASSGWIVIQGIINVTGNNATNASAVDQSGGGGGSGGHIILIARNISLGSSAVIKADGGRGGHGGGSSTSDSCGGGGGGGGRILYIYQNAIINSNFLNSTSGGPKGTGADGACDASTDAGNSTAGSVGTVTHTIETFPNPPDVTSPTISNARINATTSVEYNTQVKINATVTDDINVSNVTIQYDPPNSEPYNATAPSRNGDEYFNNTIVLNQVGHWNVTFFANDTSLNNATPVIAQELGGSFGIKVIDTTAPVVSNALANVTNNATFNQIIKINATVTDNANVRNVTIQYQLPNGTVYNLTAPTGIGSEYYNDTVKLSVAGIWNVTFFANDTSGNNATPLLTKDLGGEYSINVTGPSNTAPVISNVVPPPTQTITEDSYINVSFQFNATDANGAGDIDNSTIRGLINKTGEISRLNFSCTNIGNINSTTNRYNCTVDLWWFDGSGEWSINASVQDIAGTYAEDTSTTFSVAATKGIKIAPADIAWTDVNLGNTNKMAGNNITINNTGNVDIASGNVNVTAYNLHGQTTPSQFIYAANFTANINEACEGNALANATSVTVSSSILSSGNHSINDGTAQERVAFCLEAIDNLGLSVQRYQTASGYPWEVGVV